ncbi:hypothetical protein GCM10009530_63970 [Microbispora corallina]|uniref:Uncharacterized protein n=1 Tax=Microbispora corallina TaxID=83302 RepID=A0ABQ4GCB1_9ACTN|nr:hypothetical protein Mco01_77200 [Microbispora corallina]
MGAGDGAGAAAGAAGGPGAGHMIPRALGRLAALLRGLEERAHRTEQGRQALAYTLTHINLGG